MLINEEGDGRSYTEVAVVDNPLYAENEGDVAAYLGEDIEKPEEDEVEFEVCCTWYAASCSNAYMISDHHREGPTTMPQPTSTMHIFAG